MVTFEGDAIGIYGTVNNDHGLFSVSIDDGTATNLNGTSPNVHFQTLLYYASGLSSGTHTLKLTNISPESSDSNAKTSGLELDKVLISSWPDSSTDISSASPSGTRTQSISSSTTAATPTTIPPVHHVPTGAIAGAVIAALAGVTLFALGLFLVCRRRHRQRDAEERQNVLWQEEFRTDPFLTPPAHALGVQHAGMGGSVNGNSAFISTASSPTSPPLTFEQLTMSYAAPQASSVALMSTAIPGLSRSDVPVSASHVGSTSQATSLSPASDENPHHDFPPPEYGQVFPFPHAS